MDGVVLGFTGSQLLSTWQAKCIEKDLERLVRLDESPVTGRQVTKIVTGACVGVDAFVGKLCARLVPWIDQVVVVPANKTKVDRWWQGDHFHGGIELVFMEPGTSYMDRNDEIVRRADELQAYSASDEAIRSGTWATVRRARDRRKLPTRALHLRTGEVRSWNHGTKTD